MLSGLRTAGLLWLALTGGTASAQQPFLSGGGPVYLAYAGPYSSSPSSAFGHIFLILPSDADEPPPLWDVVSFIAETNDAGPIRYVAVGIAGGFLGRYQRLEFHEKTRDYQLLEDRDMWLVLLELTPEQRQALEDEIAATRGRWYPYTFFKKNCAHYIQLLLARATGQLGPPRGTVSPTGVMDAVLNSSLAGPSYFRPAVSRKLEAMSNSVDEDVLARLQRESWTTVAADTAWLQGLPAHERRFLQEYFAWKTLDRQSALEEPTIRGLALLRVLNARETPQEEVSDAAQNAGQPIPPPAFYRYSRVRLSHLWTASAAHRISFRYRGALRDETDPGIARRPLNMLEFIALEVSVPTDRFAPRLDALVLFSQRSLSPADWITTRSSWMLEALARRGGLFGHDALHLEVRVGAGRTVRLPARIFGYGLITAAGVGYCCSQATFAPGLELGVVWLVTRRSRLGFRWTREYDVSDWSREHQRVRVWLRYDLGRSWGVTASGDAGPLGDYTSLSLNWYP
jgi:hypothetical protein